MTTPFSKTRIDQLLQEMEIKDLNKASIRQIGAIARTMEQETGQEYIHFEMGMNDWEAMTKGIFSGEKDEFRLLQKSYRNTIEISEFAGRVLDKASGSRYQIEPVIRHGDPVDRQDPRAGQGKAHGDGSL